MLGFGGKSASRLTRPFLYYRKRETINRNSLFSKKMRIAAIDCGTNSIHMIVVRIRPDLSFEVIDREKEMVRLGSGGLEGKALTAEATETGLQTFARFRRLAESHQVEEILAAATSAVREAENGGEFLSVVAR